MILINYTRKTSSKRENAPSQIIENMYPRAPGEGKESFAEEKYGVLGNFSNFTPKCELHHTLFCCDFPLIERENNSYWSL